MPDGVPFPCFLIRIPAPAAKRARREHGWPSAAGPRPVRGAAAGGCGEAPGVQPDKPECERLQPCLSRTPLALFSPSLPTLGALGAISAVAESVLRALPDTGNGYRRPPLTRGISKRAAAATPESAMFPITG